MTIYEEQPGIFRNRDRLIEDILEDKYLPNEHQSKVDLSKEIITENRFFRDDFTGF